MKSLRQISLKTSCSAILIAGLLLQLAMPLADSALVYRFSSWLATQGQISTEDLSQILAQSQSINDMANAAAEKADTSSEANRMLGDFISQTKAQEQHNRSASLNHTPDKVHSAIEPGIKAFRVLTFVDRLSCNNTVIQKAKAPTSQQIESDIQSEVYTNPPSSGQSTLAP